MLSSPAGENGGLGEICGRLGPRSRHRLRVADLDTWKDFSVLFDRLQEAFQRPCPANPQGPSRRAADDQALTGRVDLSPPGSSQWSGGSGCRDHPKCAGRTPVRSAPGSRRREWPLAYLPEIGVSSAGFVGSSGGQEELAMCRVWPGRILKANCSDESSRDAVMPVKKRPAMLLEVSWPN